jgi:hypothetical protein
MSDFEGTQIRRTNDFVIRETTREGITEWLIEWRSTSPTQPSSAKPLNSVRPSQDNQSREDYYRMRRGQPPSDAPSAETAEAVCALLGINGSRTGSSALMWRPTARMRKRGELE